MLYPIEFTRQPEEKGAPVDRVHIKQLPGQKVQGEVKTRTGGQAGVQEEWYLCCSFDLIYFSVLILRLRIFQLFSSIYSFSYYSVRDDHICIIYFSDVIFSFSLLFFYGINNFLHPFRILIILIWKSSYCSLLSFLCFCIDPSFVCFIILVLNFALCTYNVDVSQDNCWFFC